MKRIIGLLLLGGCAAFIMGCASGPKYGQVRIAQLGQENGRIYFYRITGAFGAAIQPAVKLNGQVVGVAKPTGFFYVDRAPGNYEVETSTEVNRRLTFTLEKGQTRYVRLNIGMGVFVGHVYGELVENEKAEKEIAGCSFMESK